MDAPKKAKSRIRDTLSDHFSDTWRLLSETTSFVSRTPLFVQYEEELRAWRRDLQNAGSDGDKARLIRADIIELRKSLRAQGYDLSLARQSLLVDGFRNDAAIGEGFRRVVMFFADDDVYWLAGTDNHITLAELLENNLTSYAAKRRFNIRSKHYLWYLRKGNTLILSGSDTETKDDFERFKTMVEINSLLVLSKLKNLK